MLACSSPRPANPSVIDGIPEECAAATERDFLRNWAGREAPEPFEKRVRVLGADGHPEGLPGVRVPEQT